MSGGCAWLTDALAALASNRSLSLAKKALLHAALTRRALGDECPTYQNLADDASMSRRNAYRLFGELVRDGFLSRVVRDSDRGSQTSNRLRLHLDRWGGSYVPPREGSYVPPLRSLSGRSLLEITETSSLPPGGVKGAVVSSFVPAKLVELAESLFGEPRRRLVISALRKLGRELGEEVGPDEMARFLRYQAKHRNVTALGAPISAACEAAEFQRWQRLRLRPTTARPRAPANSEPTLPRAELAARARVALLTLPAAARKSVRPSEMASTHQKRV